MLHYTHGFKRIFTLVLLCLVFLCLVSCTQNVAQTHKPITGTDAVVRWIQQHAIPLRTVNTGGSDTDLTPLQSITGNASIVGLGEETHGTHELIDLKSRLVEYLISTMGFTTLVMENSWGMSQVVDAYINNGSGNIDEVMREGLFGSWQTQEYRALLEWMRAYNANPMHTTKIHFLGMDCQTVSQSDFNTVENYFQRVDPAQVAHVQQLYLPITANGLNAEAYSLLDASARQQYQSQAQQVYDLLQNHQQTYISRTSTQDFALALQTARVIVQFATYYSGSTQYESLTNYYQRDTFMAENVAWIHDHESASYPKLIVWAHDAHIANNTSYSASYTENMGGFLRSRYGNSYLAIGTTLYQGTFRTYHYPETSTQALDSSASDTYTYTLGQVGLPLYMLNLHNLPSGPVINWASGPHTLLLYGLDGQNLSAECALNQWYDVVIHVQSSTPSVPL